MNICAFVGVLMKYVNVINFTTVFIHTVFFFSFKLLSITKSVIVQHVSDIKKYLSVATYFSAGSLAARL
jgi:hypothetical protein